MLIQRLFDAVERRGDIGRRVAALVLPISNRARVTSSCAGKIGLREPGEHARGPNLASRDNVAHNQNLYTILETLTPVHPALSKADPDNAIRWSCFGACLECWRSLAAIERALPSSENQRGGPKKESPGVAHRGLTEKNRPEEL